MTTTQVTTMPVRSNWSGIAVGYDLAAGRRYEIRLEKGPGGWRLLVPDDMPKTGILLVTFVSGMSSGNPYFYHWIEREAKKAGYDARCCVHGCDEYAKHCDYPVSNLDEAQFHLSGSEVAYGVHRRF